MYTAEYFISRLGLEKHVEGGCFKEIYRSPLLYTVDKKTDAPGKQRNLCTTIYFLLQGEQVSRFHSLKQDEIWFYHYGSAVKVHCISGNGSLETRTLGLTVQEGEQPQVLIPAGGIFAAENVSKKSFSLVSCLVSPGFDFEDFEMYDEAALGAMFPLHSDLIERFM